MGNLRHNFAFKAEVSLEPSLVVVSFEKQSAITKLTQYNMHEPKWGTSVKKFPQLVKAEIDSLNESTSDETTYSSV